MRQIIFILSIFGIFLFILNRFTVDFDKKITAASFLKDDVVFYSCHKNILNRINDFNRSKLGKKLAEIDFFNFAQEFNISEPDMHVIRRAEEKINSWSGVPFIRDLLKKELSVVVFPIGNSGVNNFGESFLNNTLIVARTAYFTNIKRILDKSPGIAGTYRQSEYGSHVILSFPVEGEYDVSVCKVKDLTLISFSDKLIRSCLDTYDLEPEKRPAFTTVSEFIKNSGKTSSSAYLNLNFFNDIIKKTDIIQFGRNSLRGGRFAEILQGFNTVEWSETLKGNSIHQKLLLHYDIKKIQPAYRELFSANAETTTSFQRVSKDTVWYYWTNIFRIREIFNNFRKNAEDRYADPTSLSIENFARINQMDTEEFLSLFKSELMIAIKKRKENQFVPVPHMLTALKLEDQAKTKLVIGKILDHYKVPVTEKKSRGITINFWGEVISNKDMQPTYAIFDDYLLLASNGAQIREFRKLPENDLGLSGTEKFKKVSRGFSRNTNSLNYIDLKEMLSLTREVVNWGAAMAAILGSNTAYKTKLIIDNLIDPVLEGMSMFNTMGITSRIENETLIVESIMVLDYQGKNNGKTGRRTESGHSF